MERMHFDALMERLCAVLPAPRDDEQDRRRAFADELFNSMRNMNAAIFNDTVTEVLRQHGSGRYLTIKEFWSAYAVVKASSNAPGPEVCKGCGDKDNKVVGSGWIPVYFVNRIDGRTDCAAENCGTCNRNPPFESQPSPRVAKNEAGWEQVDWHEYNRIVCAGMAKAARERKEAKAAKITPKAVPA